MYKKKNYLMFLSVPCSLSFSLGIVTSLYVGSARVSNTSCLWTRVSIDYHGISFLPNSPTKVKRWDASFRDEINGDTGSVHTSCSMPEQILAGMLIGVDYSLAICHISLFHCIPLWEGIPLFFSCEDYLI